MHQSEGTEKCSLGCTVGRKRGKEKRGNQQSLCIMRWNERKSFVFFTHGERNLQVNLSTVLLFCFSFLFFFSVFLFCMNDFLLHYLLSSFACGLSECLTFPLETCKIHMQVSFMLTQNHKRFHSRRISATFIHIVSESGWRGLYTGLSPSLCRQVICGGVGAGSYRNLMWMWMGEKGSRMTDEVKAQAWQRFVVAGCTGGVMQVVANPLEIVKVRLQADLKNKIMNGVVPRYTSMMHALTTIYKHEGFRGMFVGSLVNFQRGALINMGWMGGFEQSKAWITGAKVPFTNFIFDGIGLQIACSLIAGTLAGLISAPVDLVRNRMMAQYSAHSGKHGNHAAHYRGSFHCLSEIIKKDGILGMYRGAGPGLIRNNLWSLSFFLTFENLNSFYGVYRG